MKRILIAAVSAALLAGPVAAQVYVGAGAGVARTQSDHDSWKGYVGYQFNPNWGVELGYTSLGENQGSKAEARTLAVVGTLPLNDRWSVLGKLGQSWNHADTGDVTSRTDLLVGAGIGYSLTQNLGLRLEYEEYGKLSKGSTINDTNSSNWSLGLKYAF
jgi:OOP family OmpA-OmpF porin